jgi:hypothetical protein
VTLRAHGYAVDPPPGWEARIFRVSKRLALESNEPTVHLANFPLPTDRGDFGGGVTDRMQGDDVFVCFFEYGAESVGRALFAHQGRPPVRASGFSSAQLQRTLPGQSGCQLFFTELDRPLCLYIVIGDHRRVPAVIAETRAAVASVKVEPR